MNKFVVYKHFKQEHFKIVLDLIQRNDWFSSIDLSDAYFSVSIHPEFRKYLKFEWNGTLWQYLVLPFGLSSAPRVFTKILKPVYAWLRFQGVRCCYYIDDSLNMNQKRDTCEQNTQLISSTLVSLGFTINEKKSQFTPCTRIVFFGYILDSVLFMVFLTEEKVEKIISKARGLLKSSVVVVKDLASFIGSIINAFYAVLEAPLYYRSLERDKIRGLGPDMNFLNKVCLSEEGKTELQWWCDFIRVKNGKLIRPNTVEYKCRTDSSLIGYGCVDLDSGKFSQGRWSLEEGKNHINYLELLAIYFALQALYFDCTDTHIEFQCDNVTAVKYVNDMGGMTSLELDVLSGNIWQWCLQRNIYISAIHIAGTDNKTADYYSRNFSDSTEWRLKPEIFKRLCKHFFQPQIDLFASRINRQLDNFVSWFPEPGASFNDAFSRSWSTLLPYIFPPFNLINKVINKIVQDRVVKAILIVPFWKSQPWFPLLLPNLVSLPVRLPRHKDLLMLAHDGRYHPLGKSLTLIGVQLSGDPSLLEKFQQELLTLSFKHGDQEPTNNIVWPGETGILGVLNGTKIPFVRLKC